MNARRCLKIASRIAVLLEQELGIGVDARRMLAERLYLRDVLLVCDAHRGNELAELASWFRRSATAAPADPYLPSGFGPDGVFTASGFGHSMADWLRDGVLAAPQPTPAELVREQLDQQRAAARRGGHGLAWRAEPR